MMQDYPFTNWDTYFNALTESLCTEFGVEFAPKYNQLCEDVGFEIDLQIMNELLEGNDPQEGLKGLVQACLDGCRYSYEIIPELHIVFKNMMQKGASINRDILKMIVTPSRSDHKDFEDDMGKLIMAKGFLLKLFLDVLDENNVIKSLLLDIIPEWDQIEPTYWEDMTIIDRETCGMPLDGKYSYIDAYYKALKNEMKSIKKYQIKPRQERTLEDFEEEEECEKEKCDKEDKEDEKPVVDDVVKYRPIHRDLPKIEVSNGDVEQFLKNYRATFKGEKTEDDDKLLSIVQTNTLSEMAKYVLNMIKEDFEDTDDEYFQELCEKIQTYL